jgi:hypothetical protein
MGSPRNIYRNLGVQRDPVWSDPSLEIEAARSGSLRLATALNFRGLEPETQEPRRRSFEEQLMLVEAGKARVVPKPALTVVVDRTLAGVSSEWMA